jgi:hypothetical protein
MPRRNEFVLDGKAECVGGVSAMLAHLRKSKRLAGALSPELVRRRPAQGCFRVQLERCAPQRPPQVPWALPRGPL